MKRARPATLNDYWSMKKAPRTLRQLDLLDYYAVRVARPLRLMDLPLEIYALIRGHVAPDDRVAMQRVCRACHESDPGLIMPDGLDELLPAFRHPLLGMYLKHITRTNLLSVDDYNCVVLCNRAQYPAINRLPSLWCDTPLEPQLSFAVVVTFPKRNVCVLACDAPIRADRTIDSYKTGQINQSTGYRVLSYWKKQQDLSLVDPRPTLYWYASRRMMAIFRKGIIAELDFYVYDCALTLPLLLALPVFA